MLSTLIAFIQFCTEDSGYFNQQRKEIKYHSKQKKSKATLICRPNVYIENHKESARKSIELVTCRKQNQI